VIIETEPVTAVDMLLLQTGLHGSDYSFLEIYYRLLVLLFPLSIFYFRGQM
jgi:hypothetical protein